MTTQRWRITKSQARFASVLGEAGGADIADGKQVEEVA
jgi:hypothetical protein